MSALGHQQTFCIAIGMSARPQKPDIQAQPVSANSGHSAILLDQLVGALLKVKRNAESRAPWRS